MTDISARLTTALADRYRIERELGQGGMATVYLAQDLKHERDVALKVLRPELGMVLGSDRFLAEIKITARLDHPHILTLIDSGTSDGLLYYVLPLVRGESLRDKLNREKQLGLDEALTIAKQVASALDYAHRQGVVHRDIKPENILLQEGEAMLADFGIALAVKEAGGSRLTETGLSLGTPQYMSPEQATGDRVDARSDMYSLGAVLYEMLAGEPPHTGATMQAVIAKLVTEPPTRLRVLRSLVPEGVEAAIMKALAKVPADRWSSAGELARALERGLHDGPTVTHPTRHSMKLVAALLVAAALVVAFILKNRTTPLSIVPGAITHVTTEPGLETQPAISPDGRTVAYVVGPRTRSRILLRPVAGGRTIQLTDDSTGIQAEPDWSPDGSQILFLQDSGVAVAPAPSGGVARPLLPAHPAVTTAAWSPNGAEIAFVRRDSLLVYDMVTGESQPLARHAGQYACAWSSRGLIACVTDRNFARDEDNGPSTILVTPAAGGTPIPVTDSAARSLNQSPVWSPDGERLYFVSNRDGQRDIYYVSITRGGRASGAPVRVTTAASAQSISLSHDGASLAYAVYIATSTIWSVPIGTRSPATFRDAVQLTFGHEEIEGMRASRDGKWLVYDSDKNGNSDIWRVPIGGGPATQLTFDQVDEFGADLSPDGKEIAYYSYRDRQRHVEVKPLDGPPEQHTTFTLVQGWFPAWSPDGKSLAFTQGGITYLVRRRPDGTWGEPLVRLRGGTMARWSPDGHYLMGGSTDFVSSDILVMPADSGPISILYRQRPSSTDPLVVGPEWSPDGRSIYFKDSMSDERVRFWSIPATGGAPRLVAQLDDPAHPSFNGWATDGKRFFFLVNDRQSDISVMELRRK